MRIRYCFLAVLAWACLASQSTAEWPDGGLLVCDADKTQIRSEILCVDDSTYVVAWEDYRESGNSQIYVEYVGQMVFCEMGNGSLSHPH